MHTCLVCQNNSVSVLLDFGPQPISNRFLTEQNSDEFKHPHLLGLCSNCGLTQLINPVPSDELRPRFDWIRYTEPEGHLDDVVEQIMQLPSINVDSIFCGVSQQEDSLLDRLNKKGFQQTKRLDLADFEIQEPCSGIETIQKHLTQDRCQDIVKQHGSMQVVFARNILEHAQDPLQFMAALHTLVQPDGFIVFEVPDYSQIFANKDFSFLWEEHALYFTANTFLYCLELGGFTLHSFKTYPSSMENAMVAIVSPGKNKQSISP